MNTPDKAVPTSQEISMELQHDKHDMVADDRAMHDRATAEAIVKRKSESRKMTCTVSFRLTPEEHARLEIHALQLRYTTVNAWVRDNALGSKGHSDINERTLRRLMGQLSEIGGRFEAVATKRSDSRALEMQTEPRETISLIRKVVLKIADILQ
jgi:hypothetical protein